MNSLPANVLVVEDDPSVCRQIEDTLAAHHVSCRSARDGRDARRLMLEGEYDLVVLDLFLPGENGLDLLKFISEHRPGTRMVCMTGTASTGSGRPTREAGVCGFFDKPFDVFMLADAILRLGGDRSAKQPAADSPPLVPSGQTPPDSLAAAALENFDNYRGALLSGKTAESADEAKKMLLEVAGALVVAVEAKDPYTRRHSEHVAFYAENVARHVGMDPELRETIRIAGLLHDIGKIAVPDSILTKPGRLSRKEFSLVRQHPKVGAGILENISLMTPEAELVRQHHENWDGSGYPEGLSGPAILPAARILNIADSIDAMLMYRTYKQGYTIPRMLSELRRCAGTQFDPGLARAAGEWCERDLSRLILPASAPQAETA